MAEINIETRFWIEKNGQTFLGSGRISLLEEIIKTGSISKAAKGLGMSYKKAWELVDKMNSIADSPLVIKETGGKNGGGTLLTEKGKSIVTEFRKLEAENRLFLQEQVVNCSFN
jgi:molybdate transport system regulatory protein